MHETQPRPDAVGDRLSAFFSNGSAGRRLPVWGLLPIVVILVGALAFGLARGAIPGGPARAAATPCDNRADCAVAIHFSGAIDRTTVERSLRIEPPVSVVVAWQGDTLLVRPLQDLVRSTTYQLSARMTAQSPPTPDVVVSFVAPGSTEPVVLVTPGAPPSPTAATTPESATVLASQPTATSGPIQETPRVPTPIPSPPAGAPTATVPVPTAISPSAPSSPGSAPTTGASAPPAAPTTAPCRITPIRGFGTLYQNQPTVAARLGCAQNPERALDVVSQSFTNGRLLLRKDRNEIVALLANGQWRTYPNTFTGTETTTPTPGDPVRAFGKLWRETPDLRAALGAPTAPEQPLAGAVEDFDRGLLLWTADRVIAVLYRDGSWESYADTFVDATPTPAPQTTPAPPAQSATPPGAASTNASPTASGCPTQPIRGFGVVYTQNPSVAARLGCAEAAEVGIPAGRQTFENGLMLWRGDTREFVVLRRDHTWTSYPDTWQVTDALADVGPPPAGRFAPVRGYGKVWRQQPGVRSALGWATETDQSLAGAVEPFAHGRLLWTSDRVIYALYADGTWQSFVDTFVDPTPTPH